MSSQDPLGSNVPPERPVNPTHFGGQGLYEPGADARDDMNAGEDVSLKTPMSEHLDDGTRENLQGEQDSQSQDSQSRSFSSQDSQSQGSMWEFARRNHVPALLAVGGIACLLVALVRRSTQRI